MKFIEIWAQLEHKRPALKTGATVEMSVANFRILLEQVYDQGVKASPKERDSAADLLRGILG